MKGCTALLPLHGGSWRMEKAGMPTWDCPHSTMFSIPLPTTKKAQILFPPVGHLSPLPGSAEAGPSNVPGRAPLFPAPVGTHSPLTLDVQGTGSLIQDEDTWVPHKGPGNGQTLFLSHSQQVPLLPYI